MSDSKKISLADILTLSAAGIYGLICFLSYNFLWLGNIKSSVVYALITALLLGGLAFTAKLIKKVSRNFKFWIITEWIILLLFVAVALFSFKKFTHVFTIFERKNEIQAKVSSNIKHAENMYENYEKYANSRINLYRSRLRSVIVGEFVNPSEYSGFGFQKGIDNNEQIKIKLNALTFKLFPLNYKQMKQTDSTWLANSKKKLSVWKSIGVVNVVNDIENNTIESYNKLKEYSKYREPGELKYNMAEDFEFQLSFEEVKSRFKNPGSATIWGYIGAIILYILLLIPYFFSIRNDKNDYTLFSFFKGNKHNINDGFTIKRKS